MLLSCPYAATSACASSSPNFDEDLQNSFLRQIREELFNIQERCSVTSWPLPVGSLSASTSSPPHTETASPDLSLNEGEDDGYEERLGWMPLLLKIHQAFASLLLPPLPSSGSKRKTFAFPHGEGKKRIAQQEGKQEASSTARAAPREEGRTTPHEGRTRAEPSLSDKGRLFLKAVHGGGGDACRIQSNEFEISSLWQLIQAQASTEVEGAGEQEDRGGARLRSGSGAGGGGARVDGAPIPGRSVRHG